MLFSNPVFTAIILVFVVAIFTLCTLKAFDWLIEKRYGQPEPESNSHNNRRLVEIEQRVSLLEKGATPIRLIQPDKYNSQYKGKQRNLAIDYPDGSALPPDADDHKAQRIKANTPYRPKNPQTNTTKEYPF